LKRFRKRSIKTGIYKSQLEFNVAKILGRKAAYEPCKLPYTIKKHYTPDFVIAREKPIYLEVKGYLRFEDQQKMKAVKETNPDLDIRFFFPVDNKVMGSRMKNSEWCAKYGFPCAIGKIPKSWINGSTTSRKRSTIRLHSSGDREAPANV
jgi:hypothetical protein